MNRLSFRTLVIAVLVTATMVAAGLASYRASAVDEAPAAPRTMLVPF
jgi:hypothetical protein